MVQKLLFLVHLPTSRPIFHDHLFKSILSATTEQEKGLVVLIVAREGKIWWEKLKYA
jgi:hypothetical protein